MIKSFKPAPVVTKQLHAEWPINLELEGTYHNLAMFFDRVGKFTRIVNISGLDVKGRDRPGDVNATITATCVATTFVLLEQAGRRAAGRGAKPAPAKACAGHENAASCHRVPRWLVACRRRAAADCAPAQDAGGCAAPLRKPQGTSPRSTAAAPTHPCARPARDNYTYAA